MPGQTFQVPDPPEAKEGEELWFDLKGKHRTQRDKDGNPVEWSEHFDVVPDIPFALLQDLSATITIGPNGEQMYGKAAVLRFMRAIIEPDQRATWDVLMRDVDRPMDLEMVTTIMLWIVGARSGRPTGPQSNSPGGSAETNGSSTASSARKAAPKKSGKRGAGGRGST